MSLWGKIKTAVCGAEPEPEREPTCPRCGSTNLISVPTDDDRARATLCGKCGWHSQRNREC